MSVAPSSFSFELANVAAVWVEAVLYGIYVCLFAESLYIMFKKRTNAGPALTFRIVTIIMFFVATAHVAINLYRFLRPYLQPQKFAQSSGYILDLDDRTNLTVNVLLCVMTWLGDALVIYRCFLVWDNNYFIIAIPVALLTGCLIVTTVAFYFGTHPDTASSAHVVQWLSPVYALAFAQNTLTTILIVFKLWKVHRTSTRSSVHNAGSRLGVVKIMRIVVESALLYTIQLLIVVILGAMKHNAQFLIQASVVPSIGIVFGLIAVRVHLQSSRGFRSDDTALNYMTTWLEDDLQFEDNSLPTDRLERTEIPECRYSSDHSLAPRINADASAIIQ
ncbi:hypothetical protein AX17_005912 [Amanita inopinata Kibby_2008]|nr:hypothetical protein AX17_005912 [Amanita inopinata Kibby_2008]